MSDQKSFDETSAAFVEWQRARERESQAIKRLNAARESDAPPHVIMALHVEVATCRQRCDRLLADAIARVQAESMIRRALEPPA